MVKLVILVICAIIAGILGRMGGVGKPFKSWQRDWLIPLLFIGQMIWLNPKSFNLGLVGAYFGVYLAMVGSLSTYWDELFGFDNLGFSGFIVGLSALPLLWTGVYVWAIIVRALVLGTIWWLLNKWRKPFLWWRGDVFEEWARYASLIITIPILLI